MEYGKGNVCLRYKKEAVFKNVLASNRIEQEKP